MEHCSHFATTGQPTLAIAVDPTTDGTLTIRLSGELDMNSVAALHETFNQALPRQFRRVVVDLSELSFCDSSGITALVLGQSEASRLGCRLVAVAPPPFVRRVFELTGVTELLGLDTAEGS